jgi:hypothetical protein
MKQTGFLIVAVLVFMVAGCTDKGTLKVTNASEEEVAISVDYGASITLPSQYFYTQSWNLKKSIFNVEDKRVNLSYGGYYVFAGSQDLTVTAGTSRTFTIESNAGVIQVQNDSDYNITQVYISSSSSSEWGDNLLSSILPPGWINEWQATPGYWDVMVRDAVGNEGASYYNLVSLNETLTLIYNGDKAPDAAGADFTFNGDPDLEKRQNAARYALKPSGYRIRELGTGELYHR